MSRLSDRKKGYPILKFTTLINFQSYFSWNKDAIGTFIQTFIGTFIQTFIGTGPNKKC